MAKKSAQMVTGHALHNEGRAYLDPRCAVQECFTCEEQVARAYDKTRGHALCQCGAVSAVHMATKTARQAWHRDHKALVAAMAAFDASPTNAHRMALSAAQSYMQVHDRDREEHATKVMGVPSRVPKPQKAS